VACGFGCRAPQEENAEPLACAQRTYPAITSALRPFGISAVSTDGGSVVMNGVETPLCGISFERWDNRPTALHDCLKTQDLALAVFEWINAKLPEKDRPQSISYKALNCGDLEHERSKETCNPPIALRLPAVPASSMTADGAAAHTIE